jgi:hypothetical protein
MVELLQNHKFLLIEAQKFDPKAISENEYTFVRAKHLDNDLSN